MNTCNDMWYYDFMNINSAVKQHMIKGGLPLSYIRYIHDIVNTKISMFKIKNIEKVDGLTDQILFTALMFCNNLCLYKRPGLGWVLCYYVTGSEYSYYYRPEKVNLIAFNGARIAEDVPYKDIVLVRDNIMDIIPFLVIADYVSKIIEIENTIFKVLKVASLPLALVGPKKMAAQLKVIAKEMGSDKPFICGDDTLPDTLKGFNINVPVQPLDVYELKQKYRNECLSSLGIYSVEEKRERIVTQELVNQNDYTDYVYQGCKMELERMIKEMNEKDSELDWSLVETYEVNVKEGIKEDAMKAGAVEKAKVQANPEEKEKEDKKDE